MRNDKQKKWMRIGALALAGVFILSLFGSVLLQLFA